MILGLGIVKYRVYNIDTIYRYQILCHISKTNIGLLCSDIETIFI